MAKSDGPQQFQVNPTAQQPRDLKGRFKETDILGRTMSELGISGHKSGESLEFLWKSLDRLNVKFKPLHTATIRMMKQRLEQEKAMADYAVNDLKFRRVEGKALQKAVAQQGKVNKALGEFNSVIAATGTEIESFGRIGGQASDALKSYLADLSGPLLQIATLAGSVNQILETRKRASEFGVGGATFGGYTRDNFDSAERTSETLKSAIDQFYDSNRGIDNIQKSVADLAMTYGMEFDRVLDTYKNVWDKVVPTNERQLKQMTESVILISRATHAPLEEIVDTVAKMKFNLGLSEKESTRVLFEVTSGLTNVNNELLSMGKQAFSIQRMAGEFSDIVGSIDQFGTSSRTIGNVFSNLIKSSTDFGFSQEQAIKRAKELTQALVGENAVAGPTGLRYAIDFSKTLMNAVKDTQGLDGITKRVTEIFTQGLEVGTEQYKQAEQAATVISRNVDLVRQGAVDQVTAAQSNFKLIQSQVDVQQRVLGETDTFFDRLQKVAEGPAGVFRVQAELGVDTERAMDLVANSLSSNTFRDAVLDASKKATKDDIKAQVGVVAKAEAAIRNEYDPVNVWKNMLEQLKSQTGWLEKIAIGLAAYGIMGSLQKGGLLRSALGRGAGMVKGVGSLAGGVGRTGSLVGGVGTAATGVAGRGMAFAGRAAGMAGQGAQFAGRTLGRAAPVLGAALTVTNLATSIRDAYKRPESKAALGKASGATVGAIAGGIIGFVGGPAGAAIGAGIGSQVGEWIGSSIGGAQDSTEAKIRSVLEGSNEELLAQKKSLSDDEQRLMAKDMAKKRELASVSQALQGDIDDSAKKYLETEKSKIETEVGLIDERQKLAADIKRTISAQYLAEAEGRNEEAADLKKKAAQLSDRRKSLIRTTGLTPEQQTKEIGKGKAAGAIGRVLERTLGKDAVGGRQLFTMGSKSFGKQIDDSFKMAAGAITQPTEKFMESIKSTLKNSAQALSDEEKESLKVIYEKMAKKEELSDSEIALAEKSLKGAQVAEVMDEKTKTLKKKLVIGESQWLRDNDAALTENRKRLADGEAKTELNEKVESAVVQAQASIRKRYAEERSELQAKLHEDEKHKLLEEQSKVLNNENDQLKQKLQDLKLQGISDEIRAESIKQEREKALRNLQSATSSEEKARYQAEINGLDAEMSAINQRQSSVRDLQGQIDSNQQKLKGIADSDREYKENEAKLRTLDLKEQRDLEAAKKRAEGIAYAKPGLAGATTPSPFMMSDSSFASKKAAAVMSTENFKSSVMTAPDLGISSLTTRIPATPISVDGSMASRTPVSRSGILQPPVPSENMGGGMAGDMDGKLQLNPYTGEAVIKIKGMGRAIDAHSKVMSENSSHSRV